jgi:hypothetical protein
MVDGTRDKYGLGNILTRSIAKVPYNLVHTYLSVLHSVEIVAHVNVDEL